MYEKRIEWDQEKNNKRQIERNISFEAIQAAIESGYLLAIVPHENPKYAHQKIMVVDMKGYIVLVPFIEDKERFFLKTVFPSRKATKLYLLEQETL